MTIGLKDLPNCITDDIFTCSKDCLGQYSLYLLFSNFSLFSELFINIDAYAN